MSACRAWTACSLLKVIRERCADVDVVMLSGATEMNKAVQAMRRGARNWLSKPVALEAVLEECRKARERAEARRRAARLTEEARWRSLGRIAEGVAHEVNNPLNIIVQAAGMVSDCLEGAGSWMPCRMWEKSAMLCALS